MTIRALIPYMRAPLLGPYLILFTTQASPLPINIILKGGDSTYEFGEGAQIFSPLQSYNFIVENQTFKIIFCNNSEKSINPSPPRVCWLLFICLVMFLDQFCQFIILCQVKSLKSLSSQHSEPLMIGEFSLNVLNQKVYEPLSRGSVWVCQVTLSVFREAVCNSALDFTSRLC